MRLLAPLCAVGIASLVVADPAVAQNKFEEILDRGYVLVGTGSTNPPWHFMDENDQLVGFDVDMGRLIAKAFFDDVNAVQFVEQSADARIPNLVTGVVDVSCQFMTITPSRAQQVEFTRPYFREGVGLMMLASGEYQTYDQLLEAGSDITVSVLQNVFAEEMVHRALPEATVDQYESVDLMYQALNSGRAQAAATDQSSLRWFMVQNPDRYVDAGFGWDSQTYACAVRPGEQRLLNFINTTFEQALTGVEFPFYAEVYERWLGEEVPPPQVGYPREYR